MSMLHFSGSRSAPWKGPHDPKILQWQMACQRRTKAVLIYRQKGNLRAGQLLLGHPKIESTVRDHGIEVDDAIGLGDKVDI
jgi:hypothetical protein